MNRRIASVLLASTLLLSTGCTSNKVATAKTDKNITAIAENPEKSKELYDIHTDLYPKMKTLYEQYGFIVNEYNYIDNKYYSGNQGFDFNLENVEYGSTYCSKYEMLIDNNDQPVQVYATMNMKVDPEYVKQMGFKVEDTFFARIDKVMTNNALDYTDLNTEITNAYNNEEPYLDTIKKYDNASYRIIANGDVLEFTLTLHSNK